MNGAIFSEVVNGLQIQVRSDEESARYLAVGPVGHDPVEIPTDQMAAVLELIAKAAATCGLKITQR